MLKIRIDVTNREEWDRFVRDCKDSTVAHLYGWKDVIEKAYGYRGYYISAFGRKGLEGILPLIFLESRIFGRQLVSMPYLDYGGILIHPESQDKEEILVEIIKKVVELKQELKAKVVNLRHLSPIDLGWERSLEKVTMVFDIPEKEEELYRKIGSERRNRLKKAVKEGLSAEVTGPQVIDEFYEVFASNMRDLGSPVHSIDFFKTIFDVFPATRIVVVKYKDRVVGAGVVLLFKDTLLVPWVSSLRRYFSLYPNVLLYWEVMRYGQTHGYKYLDFGRSSKGSGTFEFKRRWGAEAKQLYWYYLPQGKIPSPSTEKERYRPLIEVWKRLPISLTKLIGPTLRRGISN